jgi:hypothetical protein
MWMGDDPPCTFPRDRHRRALMLAGGRGLFVKLSRIGSKDDGLQGVWHIAMS